MKKFCLLLLICVLCLNLAACGKSEELQSVEERIFTYAFNREDRDNLEKLNGTQELDEWLEEEAIKIGNGEYTEIQVNAFLCNLDECDVRNKSVLEQCIKYFKADSYAPRLKTEDVVTVLQELDEAGYYNHDSKSYYKIFKDTLTPEQVREAAREQLEACNLDNGYYNDPANQPQNKIADDGALLRWEWSYSYMGDFCVGTMRTFHYTLNTEISGADGVAREYQVYYKGKGTTLDHDKLRDAQEIYLCGDGMFIIYTKYGEIYTNFTRIQITKS